jgi:hypothetical protein
MQISHSSLNFQLLHVSMDSWFPSFSIGHKLLLSLFWLGRALETSIMISLWPQRVERRKSRIDSNKDSVKTRTWPIRMLQAQPTRTLFLHLISIEIEQCPRENGWKPQLISLLWQSTQDPSLLTGAFVLFLDKPSYLYAHPSLLVKFILWLCETRALNANFPSG